MFDSAVLATLASGRHQAATDCLRAIAGLDYVKCLLLAAAHAQAGQTGPARAMADAVLRVRPALRVADVGLWRMFRRAEEQRKLRDALRLAGLPA